MVLALDSLESRMQIYRKLNPLSITKIRNANICVAELDFLLLQEETRRLNRRQQYAEWRCEQKLYIYMMVHCMDVWGWFVGGRILWLGIISKYMERWSKIRCQQRNSYAENLWLLTPWLCTWLLGSWPMRWARSVNSHIRYEFLCHHQGIQTHTHIFIHTHNKGLTMCIPLHATPFDKIYNSNASSLEYPSCNLAMYSNTPHLALRFHKLKLALYNGLKVWSASLPSPPSFTVNARYNYYVIINVRGRCVISDAPQCDE